MYCHHYRTMEAFQQFLLKVFHSFYGTLPIYKHKHWNNSALFFFSLRIKFLPLFLLLEFMSKNLFLSLSFLTSEQGQEYAKYISCQGITPHHKSQIQDKAQVLESWWMWSQPCCYIPSEGKPISLVYKNTNSFIRKVVCCV